MPEIGVGGGRESERHAYKRPGPRLSACQWCGKVTCNHCRCTGQGNCTHAPGEMCKNPRYKRRLVCNPCEKNKLKQRQMYQQSQERKLSKCRIFLWRIDFHPIAQASMTAHPLTSQNMLQTRQDIQYCIPRKTVSFPNHF